MKIRFLSAYALLALLGCVELGAKPSKPLSDGNSGARYFSDADFARLRESSSAQRREPGNDDFSGASASKYGWSFIGNVKGTDVGNFRSQAILRFVNIPSDFSGSINAFIRGRGANQYAACFLKFFLSNGTVSDLRMGFNRKLDGFKPKHVTFKYKGQDAFGIMVPHSISLTEFALYGSGLKKENFEVHEVKKGGEVEAFKALGITDIEAVKDAAVESKGVAATAPMMVQ